MMLYTLRMLDEIVRNVVSSNTEGLDPHRYCSMTIILFKIRSKYKKPAVLIDSYTPKNIARYVNIGTEFFTVAYSVSSVLSTLIFVSASLDTCFIFSQISV